MTVNLEKETVSSHSNALVWRVFAGFCVGLLLGTLFQSQALLTLSYDLEPGQFADTVVPFAESWHSVMQEWGFASVQQSINDRMEEFRTVPVSQAD